MKPTTFAAILALGLTKSTAIVAVSAMTAYVPNGTTVTGDAAG
jgi:hypothetical protein